jgi:hypothetical protein
VYYHLGRAREAVGSKEGARKSYESFLKTRENGDAADPLAADARTRLSR